MTSLLRVRDVKHRFGGIQALDGVDLDLYAGELLALIGPNGAGKSTLFNIIGGQLPPSSGHVVFDGREITGASPRQLFALGVGRTFQVAHVFGSMSVVQNVQTVLAHARGEVPAWRDARRVHQDEAVALLTRVGLEHRTAARAETLAYGEMKRLELALALAHRPRLLLMDEPTAGLGQDDRRHVMDLVASLVRDTHMSVLFTEHSMDVVFGLAQRIVVLARGRVIAAGAPAEIAADPTVREAYLGSLRLDAFHVAGADA